MSVNLAAGLVGIENVTGSGFSEGDNVLIGRGWDTAADFNAGQGDRIFLGGPAFRVLVERDVDGDGVLDSQLTYDGGTFVALGVTGLTLDGWNGLLV